jgi:AcrR family transcriptional regulator
MTGGEMAMTEAVSRREQLRQERRKEILDAALAVFAEKGYHAANVSDVAAQAGVSQGTIYWYFESKDELLTAAVLSFMEDVGQESIVALTQGTTSAARLRTLAETLVGFLKAAGHLFPLFLEYWGSSARREEAGKLWVAMLVEYKDLLVNIIETGVRDGEFKPVDAERLVWMMLAAYDGLAAYALFVPDLDLPAISHAFVETLLTGLLVDGVGATQAVD